MRLAVVVLNYNTRDLLRDCVRSVLDAAAAHAAQLTVMPLVVDSASSDGSAAMIRSEFPQVQLLASPENLGYTGGNNLALRLLGFPVEAPPSSLTLPTPMAKPDYVLLLNADATVDPDALWQMVSALEVHPTAGAAGAHLQYGDGSFQHGAFRFPSLAQLTLDLFPVAALPGIRRVTARLYDSRLNGRYPQACWEQAAPFVVDFVLGAALMVRGAAIDQVGGLDNGYFMYCEEMDWCLRLSEAGWQILAAPTAHVVHYEGQSSRQIRWPAYEQLWRSRLRFYEKHARHYPLGYRWLARSLIRLGMGWRAQMARRRFARGALTGVEAQAELNAYRAIRALADTDPFANAQSCQGWRRSQARE